MKKMLGEVRLGHKDFAKFENRRAQAGLHF